MKLCTIDGTNPLQVVAVGDATSCTSVGGTTFNPDYQILSVEETAQLSVAVIGCWAIAFVFKTIAKSLKL